MKLSRIFGMQAVSRDGKTRGYVMTVLRRGGAIDGYICSTERETEFFIDGRDATVRGDKLFFNEALKAPKTGKKIRLGYPVYSHLGKFLGHAEDFTVKDGKITYMTVGKRKFDFDALEIGDVVIVGDTRVRTEVIAKDMLIDTVLSMPD